jgi:hypothetical protein
LDKVIAYVTDETTNLNTLTTTLTNISSCVPLQLPQPYVAICYGHVMLKCCQYASNDLKVCGGMQEVSIKNGWFSLKKTFTWTKKMAKVTLHQNAS